MPIVRLKSAPKKPENLKEKTYGEYFSSLPLRGEKGEDGKTPVKGVDYFTKDEINAWLKSVTPIKGKHYFDGEKGEMGETGLPGKDGKDADEDFIIARILSEVPKPKNGKDGKDAISPELEEFKKEIINELQSQKGKKLSITDIEELENRLNVLNSKVEKNYGGHGGTERNIKTTLVSGGLYNLTSPYPVLGELHVYVGGQRLFFENGDFVLTIIGGNRVTQINLSASAQADITDGSQLNVRGK